jgi:hypothetical protein
MAYSRPQTLVILMSALGHKRTFAAQKGMSALPPTSDVRFLPKADINRTRGLLGDGSRRSRQDNPNFREFASLRIDLDRTGMLLDDDVVADG